MALTAEQLTVVRSWIGDRQPPTDGELSTRYDVLGSEKAVVREVLRKRLATFAASPATFALPGEYTQSHGENLRALKDMLLALELQPPTLTLLDGDSFGVQKIRRAPRR